VERCASKALTSVRLDGMAEQGLGDRRGVMDSCREVALSDAVMMSMAGMERLMHGSLSEDESEEDGGSDFEERAMAHAEGLLDRLVLLARCWAILARPPDLR
jgi:hypothetical protein